MLLEILDVVLLPAVIVGCMASIFILLRPLRVIWIARKPIVRHEYCDDNTD